MNTAPQLQTTTDYLKESPWLQEKRVSTLLTSVLAGKINFNTLEKELFTIARDYLMQMLRAVLEQLDQLILYSAQREGWEVADIKERTLETTLGLLTYNRRYYKKRTLSGVYTYTFLLDELLGIPPKAHVSPRVNELAVMLAAEQTYRKAAETLELLGISISHETIHQDVQVAGEHLKKWDAETALDHTGKRVVPLLIIEADGAMLKHQRRKRRTKRRFELKTAVIYEGWAEGPKGRAKLVNPTYFVYQGEDFWAALERHLSRLYDLDGCARIIIAGDGADWIRAGVDLFGAEYQYSRFHLQRELTRLFGQSPQIRHKLEKIFTANDRTAFNMFLRTLVIEEKDEIKKEKLLAFKSLINSVWEGITDWRDRDRPKPSPARGLGVIEPNVGHTISRRFKHQGASWSFAGADNLAHVRCAKRNGTLVEMLHLPGPPAAASEKHQNGYWARRLTDGLPKNDGQWLQASLPAIHGPEQRSRELALLISRLTLDWLF